MISPPPASNGLTLSGINKSFGREHVLRDLQLQLPVGALTLLLGQNGSGKSTMLRIAAGLSRPDGGTVSRGKHIAYVGHQSMLYGALTVRENLELAARLLRCSPDINSYLESWSIEGFQGKPVAELSKGQQARVAVARSLIHAPSLVLLDEPTAALDEASTCLLIEKLKGLSAAILVATHDVARLESHAKRAVILSGGSIAFDSERQESGGTKAVIQQYREINR